MLESLHRFKIVIIPSAHEWKQKRRILGSMQAMAFTRRTDYPYMEMKKLVIIILILLAAGCAHTPESNYAAPEHLKNRGYYLSQEVQKHIAPKNELVFYISPEKEPNAFLNKNAVVLTEGLFAFDDNTIKFVIAHEVAHDILGHIREIKTVSYGVTGIMMVVNAIVPGAGLLNHVINPAVTRNYSKTQETEADMVAYRACLRMGMTKSDVIKSLRSIQAVADTGGGFWDAHPSWDDRIKSIENAL